MQTLAEKLDHTGPAEKERVMSVSQKEQLARAALSKRKRNRAVSPDHQIVKWERIKVSESRTLESEKGIRAGAWRGNGRLCNEERQIPRRRGRARKENLPRGSRIKHERMSRCKSSPVQSAES